MVKLIVQRLLLGVLVLLAMSVLVFVATELLPGDVAHAILGQYATDETVAAIREQLGLDRPAYVRYVEWLLGMLSGDFGQSLATSRDIGSILATRFQHTIMLAAAAAVVAVPLSVTLGIISAMRAGSAVDRVVTVSALFLISAPEFLIAALLVILFATGLHWLPAVSYIPRDAGIGPLLHALALPVLTVTAAIFAPMTRMTRAAIVDVLSAPAMEMAILKGLPRRYIVLRHALPNAIAPIINVIVLNLAYLVSGVVVVETIFSYPGLAKLMVDGVASRDIPIVQACAIIFCACYLGLNLFADMVTLIANPRLRHPSVAV